MKRRRFLKLPGLASLFLSFPFRNLFAAAGPVVAVGEGADHARITRNAINALGGGAAAL
jgi:hypothetical protein